MAVKVFESVERTPEDEPFGGQLTALPFALPGEDHVYTATAPKRSVWSRAQLSMRPKVPIARRFEVLIDFLRGTLAQPEDGFRLEERLLDPADPLDLPDLYPVVMYLNSEWGAQMDRINRGLPAVEETEDGEAAEAQVEVEGSEPEPAVDVEAELRTKAPAKTRVRTPVKRTSTRT